MLLKIILITTRDAVYLLFQPKSLLKWLPRMLCFDSSFWACALCSAKYKHWKPSIVALRWPWGVGSFNSLWNISKHCSNISQHCSKISEHCSKVSQHCSKISQHIFKNFSSFFNISSRPFYSPYFLKAVSEREYVIVFLLFLTALRLALSDSGFFYFDFLWP